MSKILIMVTWCSEEYHALWDKFIPCFIKCLQINHILNSNGPLLFGESSLYYSNSHPNLSASLSQVFKLWCLKTKKLLKCEKWTYFSLSFSSLVPYIILLASSILLIFGILSKIKEKYHCFFLAKEIKGWSIPKMMTQRQGMEAPRHSSWDTQISLCLSSLTLTSFVLLKMLSSLFLPGSSCLPSSLRSLKHPSYN